MQDNQVEVEFLQEVEALHKLYHLMNFNIWWKKTGKKKKNKYRVGGLTGSKPFK